MQNIYRFSTLTAIACLGLGLITAGCADGGGGTTYYPFSPAPAPSPTPSPEPSPEPTPTPEPSPTPSPEPGDKATLKVEFDIVTARAEVPLEVTAYNFRLNIGDEESQAEEGVEKKADDDNPNLQTVTIEDVDPEVDNVAVEYLNEEGKVIAMSQFPVELAAGQETVADDFDTLEASRLAVSGDPGFAYVGEDMTLSATVVYGDESSEDIIEMEVASDDVTWELSNPELGPGQEIEGWELEHCFDAKEGEQGVFTAREQGTDYVMATYAEGIASGFIMSAVPSGAEFAAFWFCPAILSDYWAVYMGNARSEEAVYVIDINCIPAQPDGQTDPENKPVHLLYAENALPDDYEGPMYSEAVELAIEVQGVNEADFYLVGAYRYGSSEDQQEALALLNPSEWSSTGDFCSVKSFGQKGCVTVTGTGTGGALTATYDGKELSAPLEAEATEPVLLPAIECNGTIRVDGQDYSALMYGYPVRDDMVIEWNQDAESLQLLPAGAYVYKQILSQTTNTYYFGPYVSKNASGVTWEKLTGADSLTIDENGLVTATNAETGDKATFTFSRDDGFEPAKTIDFVLKYDNR